MSYYLKGEMVTFLLDLSIRKRHQNHRSFDDVMRSLWDEFGREEVGFTPEQLQQTIEHIAGFDLTAFFKQYIDGLEELPFEAILNDFGLTLVSNLDAQSGSGKLSPYLGLRLATEQGKTIVKAVASGSPGELAGLDAGDELVAIDGLRVTVDQLNARLQYSQPGDLLEVSYFHQDELLQTLIKLDEPQATQFSIKLLPEPTAAATALLEGWLGIPYDTLSSL